MIKPTLYAAALLAVSSAAFAPMPASAQVDVNLVIGTAPPPLRYESLPPPLARIVRIAVFTSFRTGKAP